MISRRQLLLHAGCGCLALPLLEWRRATAAPATTNPEHIDVMGVLPSGAVKLEGYLERYIELSIRYWAKGIVPYKALANFFKDGRPTVMEGGSRKELFATGEMWGKAVRSAALFYRYTGDPELKEILTHTVSDLLRMRRANGTLSCSPISRQPDGPEGDLWEIGRAHV